MRRGHGWFSTLLMLVPMTAVPLMAVFGIPQFAQVSASPAHVEREMEALGFDFREPRVGQSDAYPVRRIEFSEPTDASAGFARRQTPPAAAMDLFAPLDSSSEVAAAASTSSNSPRSLWTDPLRDHALDGSSHFDGRMPNSFDRSVQQDARTDIGSLQQTSLVTEAAHPQTASDSSVSDQPVTPDFRYSRTSRDRSGVAAAFPVAAMEPLTWTGAITELNAMGIQNYRLTPGAQAGQFRFMCFVTSVDDPCISRRFDAEAGEPLEAVRDVLTQVTTWNSSR